MKKKSLPIVKNELSQGVQLLENGKLREAQKWLRLFIDSNPKHSEALSLLSKILLLDKKDSEAEKVLLEAESIDPELPSIYRNQARLLLKKSNPKEALEKIKLAVKKSPKNPENLLILANCLVANKRDNEAIIIIDDIIESKSDYAEAFASRALIRFRSNDKNGAISDAKSSLSLKPHLAQIWSLLGSIYYQNNNFTDAISALKSALKFEPDNILFINQLGELLKLDNKVGDAIAVFQKAVDLNPKNVSSWTNLGLVFQKDKNLKEAKKAYQSALNIEPQSALILSNLGKISSESKEFEIALKYFKKALEIEPSLAETNYNLGNIFQILGKLPDAIKSYSRAIALKPDYPEAHNNLGNTHKELDQFADSEINYKKALVLKPDYVEAHNNLGNLLQELGRLEEAELSYKKSIILKPEYAQAHNNLGTIYKELGRSIEAEKSYKKAIALNSDFSEAHYNLGLLFFKLKKYNLAAEQFEIAKIRDSKLKVLKCSYVMDEKNTFYNNFNNLVKEGENNSLIGSLGLRSKIKYGVKKSNPFCNDPLSYVTKIDLNKLYNFEDIFSKTAQDILSDSSISFKDQGLLTNGVQTSGNFFSLNKVSNTEIESIIRDEIEKYRIKFKTSKEGIIKSWPTSYRIEGWLVSMQSGGRLDPHIHETGWITGSVYISVPSKSKFNSGDLVLCLNDEKNIMEMNEDQYSIVEVAKGDLCLFPSSLHHHTIPFEENVNRIVLAFDVIPNI